MKKTKVFNTGNWSGKPYNFFGDYLHDRFSCRVLKLPINAGLSCPNRDGTTGSDGCIFCCEDGSASPTTTGIHTISDQMQNAIHTFRRSDRETKYIAYFQAFTNTYAPLYVLEKLYDEASSFPGITGLMIATRPDCIDRNILNLISRYKKPDFELWIELGIQSFNNSSLNYLRRGHTAEISTEAIKLISDYNIPVCIHIILGIPGETWDDMMQTAEIASSLPVNGIKLHHLHVIKNTGLENIYNTTGLELMSMKEYVSTLCDFIERLRPDIIIHRLMGDREENSLLYPRWGLHKGTVIKAIEDEFKRRGTYQGFLCYEEF